VNFEFNKEEPHFSPEEKAIFHRQRLENAKEKNHATVELEKDKAETIRQIAAFLKERRKTFRGFFASTDIAYR